MKKVLLILSLVVSTNLLANTITDKTCDIYLPVNDVIFSWGENKQILIEKGYNPIEVYIMSLNDTKKIRNNSLVGEIGYSRKYGSISLWNGFDVDLGIYRMRDNTTAEMASLYYKRGTAKYTRKAETRAFRGLPNCVTE